MSLHEPVRHVLGKTSYLCQAIAIKGLRGGLTLGSHNQRQCRIQLTILATLDLKADLGLEKEATHAHSSSSIDLHPVA